MYLIITWKRNIIKKAFTCRHLQCKDRKLVVLTRKFVSGNGLIGKRCYHTSMNTEEWL